MSTSVRLASVASQSAASSSTQEVIGSLTSSRRVQAGRIIFALTLAVVTAILATLTYIVVNEAQNQLALVQFESIAERALTESLGIFARKKAAVRTMATVIAHAQPDAATYPFVAIPGYEAISNDLKDASGILGQSAYMPVVRDEQIPEFNEFAYTHFEERFPDHNSSDPSTPLGFEGGMWMLDAEGRPVVITEGQAASGYVAPIFHSSGGPIALMFDVGTIPEQKTQLDDMLRCSDDRRQLADLSTKSCAALTDLVHIRGSPPEAGPGVTMLHPVFPANDPTQVRL